MIEPQISYIRHDLYKKLRAVFKCVVELIFLMNVIAGDEVSFIVKHTPKGVQADGLQLMIAEVTSKSFEI